MSVKSDQQPAQEQQTKKKKKKTKTVYLIRHAQSEENVKYDGFRSTVSSLISFSFPTLADMKATAKLSTSFFRKSVMDAPVSKTGRRQIRQLNRYLMDTKFPCTPKEEEEENVTSMGLLVVHSPLQRAKETAYGCFSPQETITTTTTNSNNNNNNNVSFLELEFLREINPKEYVRFGTTKIDERIVQFETWLESRPEQTFVIVGHSIYFQRLLQLSWKFRNCDLFQYTFLVDVDDDNNGDNEASSQRQQKRQKRQQREQQRRRRRRRRRRQQRWTEVKQLFKYNASNDNI